MNRNPSLYCPTIRPSALTTCRCDDDLGIIIVYDLCYFTFGICQLLTYFS